MSVVWNFLFLSSVLFLINSVVYTSPVTKEENDEKNSLESPKIESGEEDLGTVSPEELEKLKEEIIENQEENAEKFDLPLTNSPEKIETFLKEEEKEYGKHLPEEIEGGFTETGEFKKFVNFLSLFDKIETEGSKTEEDEEIVEKSPAEMKKMKEEVFDLTNELCEKQGLPKVTQEEFDKFWNEKKEEYGEKFPRKVEEAIVILKAVDKEESTSPASEANETSSEESEPSEDEAPKEAFVVQNAKGKICILAKFHSIITISFSGKEGEQKVEVNVPSNANSEGKCAGPNHHSSLKLSWQKFVFALFFNKTSEDTWGVTSVELIYDKSEPLFDGAVDRGKVTAKSKNVNLFETPFGNSYYCPAQEVILLFHENQQVATVRLKETHLQPYEVEDGKFSASHRCNQVVIGSLDEELFVQDETIPLAVGCTLALITLLILVGFSVHRAYNAAKVDYNAVE